MIRENWWYDVKLYDSQPALTRGIAPTTEFYKCPHRDACLVAVDFVPQTMYCAENHTGIMCSSCYHRRTDCGRGGMGRDGGCPGPTYFERGHEWMYFSIIARHCQRCPAGNQALIPLFITIGVAIGAVVVIAFIIVLQLNDVEQRVTQLARGHTTDHNASGPIARLLLNWLQATALLSTIKLTPPAAVQDVSVYADYAQGISTDWYSIACTIRLNVWMTFAWNLLQPILAAVIPALIVLSSPPIRRLLSLSGRRCKRCCARCASSGNHADTTSDGSDSAATSLDGGDAETEVRGHMEMGENAPLLRASRIMPLAPRIIDASPAAVGGAREGDGVCTVQPGDTLGLAAAGDQASCSESDASSNADSGDEISVDSSADDDDAHGNCDLRERTLDARYGFYKSYSSEPLELQAEASYDAPPAGFAVLLGDVVRAEGVDGEFVCLRGTWGEGWLPLKTRDGVRKMHAIAAGAIRMTHEYAEIALPPNRVCAESDSVSPASDWTRVEHRVYHRFRALVALCPERGITRDVIEK